MSCPGCGKRQPSETHADAFCKCCYPALTAEQREAYFNAVTKLWNAPPGRFGFLQRQLEMVVEDLTRAVAA